jgi:cell wall-associated NlpC family hydrolase
MSYETTLNPARYLLFLVLTIILFPSCEALRRLNEGSKPNSTLAENRRNVTDYSKKFVGAPYKYAGKDPKGFDCSGFTSYVMQQGIGVALSPSSALQATQGKPVPLDKVKAGDLIFFGKKVSNQVSHVALVLSNTAEGITVIHSTTSKGVLIQNISTSEYWQSIILFARDVLSD